MSRSFQLLKSALSPRLKESMCRRSCSLSVDTASLLRLVITQRLACAFAGTTRTATSHPFSFSSSHASCFSRLGTFEHKHLLPEPSVKMAGLFRLLLRQLPPSIQPRKTRRPANLAKQLRFYLTRTYVPEKASCYRWIVCVLAFAASWDES